jgi:hypothetical protein
MAKKFLFNSQLRQELFASPKCPDQIWVFPSLLSNGHHRLFLRGLCDTGVTLSTHPPSCAEIQNECN